MAGESLASALKTKRGRELLFAGGIGAIEIAQSDRGNVPVLRLRLESEEPGEGHAGHSEVFEPIRLPWPTA